MLKHRTVFILGAGASKDYGYPSGPELLQLVREDCLSVQNRHFNHLPGGVQADPRRYGALRELIDNCNFRSIDALLAAYPDFIDIGKLLIALRLLPCERPDLPFQLNMRSANWMLYLVERLQGENISDCEENDVTFITFNYDRCLEYFLERQLRTTYPRASDESIQLVLDRFRIIHVHGHLGALRDLPHGSFDLRIGPVAALEAANQITIIHEANPKSPEFEAAWGAIEAAERVGFLGFGFHSTNIVRLRLATLIGSKLIYGSAKDMTEPELIHIRSTARPGRSKLVDGDCLSALRNTELLY
jgi:hypothetical protein